MLRRRERILPAFLLLGLLTLTSTVTLAQRAQMTEPDYTKGETLDLEGRGALNYAALGSTGATGYIWAFGQVRGTDRTRMIQIKSVAEGTPADGLLQEGDVILGIGDSPFSSDARKALSAAITEAEEAENGGTLILNVWRPADASEAGTGETMQVTLELPVLGSFSDTSPWECDKTRALIDAAAGTIVERGLVTPAGVHPRTNQPVPARAKGGIATLLDALGLLATGEEQYLPVVQEYARLIGRPDLELEWRDAGGSSWSWGYTLLFLTEYFLATGDEAVLPAIERYAHALAMGASDVGTFSHGMAQSFMAHGIEHKYPSAYGAMNQSSITCGLALVLSQKCGVTNPEVDRVVNLSRDFYTWFADKGAIPYGDHAPAMAHDNNGVNSQAAVLFDLVGDKETADYFTRAAIASYPVREAGHTGHFFSWQWGALGAARGGPEAAQSFARNTRWFTELERRPDGSSFYQPQLSATDHGKYTSWSTTGSRLLQHCLPRRQLYITGKGGVLDPITGDDLNDVVAAGAFDPTGLSVEELLQALGSWSPVVREQAAQELGERDDHVVEELIAMLDSPDRYVRYGACSGLRYAGRQSEEAVDRLIQVIEESEDLALRYYASMAFRQTRIWQGPPIRAWRIITNGLAPLGEDGPARRAVPALLRQAATVEPETDPRQRLPGLIAGTLFYRGNVQPYSGYFPGGRGMETLDRDLLIPAIRVLLQNPNGGVRSTTSSIYRHLTPDDLESLWNDIYWATKYQAPSGSMFAGGVRGAGLNLMADHRVREGIELGIDWTFTQWGWGQRARLDTGVPILAKYGRNLEPHLPEIEAIIDGIATHRVARARRDHTIKKEAFERLRDELPDTRPELISIQEYIKDDPLKPAETE